MAQVDTNTGLKISVVSVHAYNKSIKDHRLVFSMSEFEEHLLSHGVLSTKTGKRKSSVECFVCDLLTRSYWTLYEQSHN